jgi:hypothetical protein
MTKKCGEVGCSFCDPEKDRDEPQGNDLLRIYEALQLGKQEEATRRMKEYVCNKLGRVL